MDELQLLISLHENTSRQGPGGATATRLSITLSGLETARGLTIADIGCGSGASTLVLAQHLDAHITAVDLVPDFLARLEADAARAGVAERIETLAASMDALPFAATALDAIWSEGAIYNMGFANGVAAWRNYLKPGGILALSELTWLTRDRPAELAAHWLRVYSEVATAAAKLAILEQHGFSPLGYFVLPETCWLDNYYRPLERQFAGFLAVHGNSDAARAVVDAERREIELYERYKDYVGYGYYVAKKLTD